MKKRTRNYRNQSKIKTIVMSHIESNLNLYVIAGIVFLIGIILGVLFINNISTAQLEEMKAYINNTILDMKQSNANYLKELIVDNIFIIFILWFAGITIIGIIINYFILLFKGFCIGYTISSIALTLGTWKGITFVLITMLAQNLLLIPAIIATTVSGMRFFKAILEDRRKESDADSPSVRTTWLLAVYEKASLLRIKFMITK